MKSSTSVTALAAALLLALSMPTAEARGVGGSPGFPGGSPSHVGPPGRGDGGWHGGGWHGGDHHGRYYRGGYWGPGFFWGGLGLGLGIGMVASYGGDGYVFLGDGGDTDPEFDVPPSSMSAPVDAPAAVPSPPLRRGTGRPVPLTSRAADPIFYPRNGQTPARTEADRRECNRWATTQPGATNDASIFQRATFACMDGRGYVVR